MIRDTLKFLWRRDSESACVLVIHLAAFLNDRDLRQLGEYLKQLAALKPERP